MPLFTPRSLAIQICVLLAPGLSSAADCFAMLELRTQTDLTLSFTNFDQSESMGWRPLSAQGCHAEAAAMSSNTPKAIEVARTTLRPEESELKSEFQWNTYVNATVSFLQNDRQSFELHRDRLAQAAAKYPINRPNFEAVRRLSACFGKKYEEAYSCGREP